MEGLLLLVAALLLIGLGTWGVFYVLGRMQADVTFRWILTVLAFIALLYLANRFVGFF